MFNENTFRALDWLLDEARLHGLRVVLSFIDNWKYPGKPFAGQGSTSWLRSADGSSRHGELPTEA